MKIIVKRQQSNFEKFINSDISIFIEYFVILFGLVALIFKVLWN